MKNIAILMCVMVVGLFAVERHFVDMPPDLEGNTGQSLPFNGYRSSPGEQVGETDYDFQNNGSLGRYVCVTPSGGLNFYWTYSYDSTSANRRAYYNYWFPPSYWLGPTSMDPDQSRMGSLGQMSDGRAVASAHSNVTGGYASNAYVDAAEGAGTFTIHQMPDPGSAATPIWPKITVDQNGHIYCAATVNGGTHSFWTKSTDEGVTWLPWDSTLAGVPLNLTTYYLQAGRESWESSHNTNWTMLANSTGALDAKVCWETDGSAWYYDTIWANTPTDSVTVWFWTSVVYDNNAYAHVVFDVQDTASVGGGAQQSGWRSQIWHWNQQTDVISPGDNGMGWFFTNPGPGYNHGTVSEPQIAINRANGDLYCT